LGRCDFHGVGLVPGETTAFGIVGSRPVLVMPGRFDAALAAWLTLGRRMLALMCARSPDDPASPAILTRKVTSTVGFAEVIVARWNDKDGEIVPLGSEYLSARALAAADGWFLVPAEAEGYPAGTSIALRLLP
jgi:molybdopterin biosynthesis enzyme